MAAIDVQIVQEVLLLLQAIVQFAAWLRSIRCNLSSRRSANILTESLYKRGFRSLSDFAETEPHVSLRTIATMLGAHPDLEWVVLTRLLTEAELRRDVERFARSLVVRFLHHGPPPEFSPTIFASAWGVELALYRVAMILPKRHRAACLRVALGYQAADIPFAWIPQNSLDSVLTELFVSYWPEPMGKRLALVRLPDEDSDESLESTPAVSASREATPI
jgi:hypothetical protein